MEDTRKGENVNPSRPSWRNFSKKGMRGVLCKDRTQIISMISQISTLRITEIINRATNSQTIQEFYPNGLDLDERAGSHINLIEELNRSNASFEMFELLHYEKFEEVDKKPCKSRFRNTYLNR
jgi:hypothetical protein